MKLSRGIVIGSAFGAVASVLGFNIFASISSFFIFIGAIILIVMLADMMFPSKG